jgi:hypothetical protein
MQLKSARRTIAQYDAWTAFRTTPPADGIAAREPFGTFISRSRIEGCS